VFEGANEFGQNRVVRIGNFEGVKRVLRRSDWVFKTAKRVIFIGTLAKKENTNRTLKSSNIGKGTFKELERAEWRKV